MHHTNAQNTVMTSALGFQGRKDTHLIKIAVTNNTVSTRVLCVLSSPLRFLKDLTALHTVSTQILPDKPSIAVYMYILRIAESYARIWSSTVYARESADTCPEQIPPFLRVRVIFSVQFRKQIHMNRMRAWTNIKVGSRRRTLNSLLGRSSMQNIRPVSADVLL